MDSPYENKDEVVFKGVARALLIAPLVFAGHVLEEAPRFVEWFNSHVERGITAELFWSVNLFAGVITVMIAGAVWLWPSRGSVLVAAAWLSFLMLANAIFHLVATLVDGAYAPGLVTALLLYLPYFVWVIARIMRSRQVRWELIVGVIVVGASPMLVHGYRIVFMRSRLF